ncbi:MAG: peptidylprolyl isomerase [Oscillospiraceae bacterium]
MKKFLAIFLCLSISAAMVACGDNDNKDNQQNTDTEDTQMNTPDAKLLQFEEPTDKSVIATMKTNKGDIEIMLFPEEAPLTVENFVTHAVDGYYDGLIFHRVINSFMIQGGDPTGTGMGGESIYKDESGNPVSFEDEFVMGLHNFRGALSMANAGPSTNGSQFFIVQASEIAGGASVDALVRGGWPKNVAEKYMEVGGTPHLDFKHTVFGQVIKGMDVVDAIAATKVDRNDKPVEDVIIETITVKNNPYAK